MVATSASADGERFFSIFTEDLDRLSRWIQRTGRAQFLTALARRFTRGRLRYGPLEKGVQIPEPDPSEVVRIWDPARAWREGDGAVFVCPPGVPCYGEVVRVLGLSATVRVDGRDGTQLYGIASTRDEGGAVDGWRESVEALVSAARARSIGERGDAQRSDEDALIDYALWTYGELIFGRLRNALRHDSRFVVLQGRWFLRSQAVRPSQDRLTGLTQRLLLEVEQPLSTAEIVPLLTGSPIQDDAQLYGLFLALGERPDLFTNVGRGGRDQWVLSRPPEGDYAARLAAYDPETGEVLCEPGEVLSRETVERLWALDLLRVVIARQTGMVSP